MKQLANFITLLNLVFGCIAIVFTLQTGETIVNLESGEWKIYFPEKITWAAICLFFAAAVDFLMDLLPACLKQILKWENNLIHWQMWFLLVLPQVPSCINYSGLQLQQNHLEWKNPACFFYLLY